MSEICPLCKKHPLATERSGGPPAININCEWCGNYWMIPSVPAACKSQYAVATWKLAAYVREKTLQGIEVVLYPAQADIPADAPKGSVGLDKALEGFPTSVAERLDRVLMNLERQTKHLGQAISLREESRPTLFAQNIDEITFTLRQLADAAYLAGYHSTFPCNVVVSGKGLIRVADLQRGLFGPLSTQAFVAMSFDKSLDAAWADGLKLGIEDCGFAALRVDAKEHNEKICDVIIAEIRKSKFLVADFTLHRGGVYFEAGLMMGVGRPTIFTCRNDEMSKAHFDTRQYKHIGWDTPAELREKVKRRIQATIAP